MSPILRGRTSVCILHDKTAGGTEASGWPVDSWLARYTSCFRQKYAGHRQQWSFWLLSGDSCYQWHSTLNTSGQFTAWNKQPIRMITSEQWQGTIGIVPTALHNSALRQSTTETRVHVIQWLIYLVTFAAGDTYANYVSHCELADF